MENGVGGGHAVRLVAFAAAQAVGHDGEQDDEALDRLFPIRRLVEMGERGVDVGEQQQAGQDAPQLAAPAGDRDAADDARRR